MNVAVTPDGTRYLTMAKGQRVALPFHLRWLLPKLNGQDLRAWFVSTWLGIVLATTGTAALAAQHHLSGRLCLAAAVLFVALPSVRLCIFCPVLVDMPSTALAVCAAVVFHYNPAAGIALALVAGCVNERAPIFAALFAWNPFLLIGMAAPALRKLQHAGVDPLDDRNAQIIAHPFKSSLAFHKEQWRNPYVMVLPWGGCLAALAGLDLQLCVALAFAYAQLLLATDSVRLYQQAAPIVCVAAVGVLPLWALPLVLVAHVFNPVTGGF